MKLKEHWRAVCRGIAALLLLTGLFCGYWWFYKLAPAKRTGNSEWCESHSEQEYWREVQKGIHRGMWRHDDGFAVGKYGDKSWAEWIMAHVRRGESMGCFGRLSHSAHAMRYITNQDVGYDADSWHDWWAKNKSKSQNEWIGDGFRQQGFEIDVPPSSDQMPALLGLLADSDADESAEIPDYIYYNAFRCLRESDFDPVGYAISDRPFPADVERGLLEYARLQRAWIPTSGVGNLSFGRNDHEDKGAYFVVAMLEPEYQFVAYSLVFVPLLLGTCILAWSFRKKTGCEEGETMDG